MSLISTMRRSYSVRAYKLLLVILSRERQAGRIYEIHDFAMFAYFTETRDAHNFAHGGCIFADKRECLTFFENCHQRLVRFGVKRINFSFRLAVKNARAETVWTVHCASTASYQRKKSVITCEKKIKIPYSWHISSISGFTFWALCQLLFSTWHTLVSIRADRYFLLDSYKEFFF